MARRTDNLYGQNQFYEQGRFLDIDKDTIINNLFIVLNSAFEVKDKRPSYKRGDFNQIIDDILDLNKKETKWEDVYNQLKSILDQARKNEEDFLQKTGSKIKNNSSDEEKRKAFESYFNIKKFFKIKKGTKATIEPLINSQIFSTTIIESLENAVKTDKYLTKKSYTDIIGNALKEALKQKSSTTEGEQFFLTFDRTNEGIIKDLEYLYGTDFIKKLITNIRRNKGKASKNIRKEMVTSEISGKTHGLITEYLNSELQNTLNEKIGSENVKIEYSGIIPKKWNRIISHTVKIKQDDKTKEDKEVTKTNLGRTFDVSQKSDAVITATIKGEKNIDLTYNIYISNKFRQKRSMNELSGSGSLNSQIPKIQELISSLDTNRQKEFMLYLTFCILNTVKGAIFNGKIHRLEKIIEQLSIGYMFDEVSQLLNETEVNTTSKSIFLFQINENIFPLSTILSSLLNSRKKSYINIQIHHNDDGQVIYERLLAQGENSAINLRDYFINDSRLSITYNRNLMFK